MFTSEKMVKFLREKYPPGTRIRLVSMEDPYAPVAPGTEGTLVCVDDAGQFQMKWDNGRTLALIPGEDSFTVLPPERSMLKLYMPLTAELYEPDEWGDMPEEAERLTGGELASYEDKIRSALFKSRMQEEQVRGIMHWYRKPDSVNDKVHAAVFDVEQRHGRLWGVAECQISGELSAGELAALKKYISGQASDGWGEGFEQREIALDGGKLVVDYSKTAHVYHYIDKEGNPCTEDYLNEHMSMMEVAMLTSGNGAGSKLYTEETFENNDGWGFQHTTVMQNFAAHILTGSPLLAPGEDGINGVNLANSSQLSAWTGREVSNPCDPEEYAAELNKLIEAEGKFPVRE